MESPLLEPTDKTGPLSKLFAALNSNASDEKVALAIGDMLVQTKAGIAITVLTRPHLAPSLVENVHKMDLLTSYALWMAFVETIRNEKSPDKRVLFFAHTVHNHHPDKVGAMQSLLLANRPHLLKEFGLDEGNGKKTKKRNKKT